jgi:glycosyltransferase involved in cell wall biosynthesis
LDKRRISLRIMEELVSFPNVEIYIYGLVHPNMKKTLERYSNIKLRGILKGNLLTEDLKSIDVGIAPYRLSDVNPGGTPNKLWLYLAVGKPVVISDLPSIREWQFPSDFVYRAKDDRDFISQVFNAYRKDSIELMNSRACFARENSWANRVRTLLERLFSAMNQEDSTAGFLGDMSKPL